MICPCGMFIHHTAGLDQTGYERDVSSSFHAPWRERPGMNARTGGRLSRLTIENYRSVPPHLDLAACVQPEDVETTGLYPLYRVPCRPTHVHRQRE